MYRVSPLTYIVGGLAATGLAGKRVDCSSTELSIFQPPKGETCGAYLTEYLAKAPGQLYNPSAASNCSYCSLTTSDQFLAGSEISWSTRWRNFGIVWAYICFNIFMVMTLYYAFRVKKWDNKKRRQRWSRVASYLKWTGILARAIILGAIGQVFFR